MRARSIKPGICDNEILGTADPFYTLLFERLWLMADREGRLEDRPMRIKAQAFPYREGLDVEPMLAWLAKHGFIQRYQIDGNRFIQVSKFAEHQSPHIKEAVSKIPAPDKPGASPVQASDEEQPKPALAALTPSSLTPDSGLLTPDSGLLTARTPESSPAAPVHAAAQEVFQHWQREWNHPSAKLDGKRLKRIEVRLKDFTVGQLRDAITGFKHSPWHTGTDPKGDGVVYDGIETLLRDTSQVEIGLRLFAHPPRPPPKPEQLSPVERVLRANGVSRDGRVVAEQFGSGDAGVGDVDGHVREPPYAGFRRIGS